MAPPRSNEFKADTYKLTVPIIKARIESIKTAVEKFNSQTEPLSNLDQKKLTAYLNEVENKKTEFESLLKSATMLNDDTNLPFEMLMRNQDEIGEMVIDTTSLIEALLSSVVVSSSAGSSNDSSTSTSTITSQIRLPKLDLPTFNGTLESWTSFINLFNTSIHFNNSIPEVMKFQYLLSVLRDEPSNLVKSLNLTAENYNIAYKLLNDRYHNIRRLQSLHLSKLLDLPAITASDIQSLRQFINSFTENSQALNALKCPVLDSNPLLATVLLRKMDVELRKRLEIFRSKEDSSTHSMPEVSEIIDFLTKECNQTEDASLSSIHQPTEVNAHFGRLSKPPKREKPAFKNSVSMVATQSCSKPHLSNDKSMQCFVCNQTSHKVYSCPIFKNKTPKDRFNLVKHHKKCVSCLGSHVTNLCQSQSLCKICNKRHHTLLHFNEGTTNNDIDSIVKAPREQSQNNENPLSKSDSVIPVLTSQDSPQTPTTNTTVLLGTVLVQLSSPNGQSHVFRALLDSGSMCNLITEHAANLLNVRRYKSDIKLSGIDHHLTGNKGQTYVDFKTLSGKVIAPNQPSLILDKLTVDLPRVPLSKDLVKLTRPYTLADPTFHIPSRIDVVIGSSLFPQLFTQERIPLGHNMPYILGTHFGYVLMGTAPCMPIQSKSPLPSATLNVCLHSISDADLHSSIQRFWIQEEPPTCSIKTQEEQLCDEHFLETHSRDANGRYVVRLPFKDSCTVLGESKTAAKLRLEAMERKFNSNTYFAQLYRDFMDEYSSLNHMTELKNSDISNPHYYLPHHGVLKEGSSTTKLRTVFDASCKSSSGQSLNDILLTGPKLQNNICDLLMKFRIHNVVFCCDIRQMYRQILIHPDDRNFQLILWRNQPNQPPSTYQLNTVTYGMNSSPYLAIKTLHQLADDEGKDYPDAARVLKDHSYVDDIITGAESEEEAIILQQQLISLLSKGCFELRKWVSNSPKLLGNLPETHLESPKFLQNSDTPQFKVLGLQWSPSTDFFSYNFHVPLDVHITKRIALGTIAKIYDPCGFLTPFIMLTKSFMQLLWTKNLSWDERCSEDLVRQWQLIMTGIECLQDITIPRAFCLTSSVFTQLHGFCDASETGYAAVVYVRCEMPDHQVKVSLILAKSRVAPLKRVTIPRLELCAAHLLAQLVSCCKTIFTDKVNDDQIYLWSDSTVVLSWLQTPPYRLKTYVANRVANIQELVPGTSWKHIASEHNPADCASRGMPPKQLLNHPLWWTGPDWLSKTPCQLPTSNFIPIKLDASHELKETPLTILITSESTSESSHEFSLLTKFSSWDTLVRVMALVIRFCDNCKSHNRRVGYITTEELNLARIKIFSLVQKSSFADELTLLANEKECPKRIQRLNPFLDKNGLIRVGGRLKNSSLPTDVQHPILLPKNHYVVHLLIDHFHVRYLHAGPQLVQSLLTQQVWILSARSTIRSRVHNCLICFKHRPKNVEPLMGDLPASRVTPAKPFSSTGIDYGGPFTIKMLNFRFVKQTKVYICVFVCMVTKAVHIEVVTDLTTEAFIAALTRFLSRRGKCTDIYSDCGTNFVGASALLRKNINSIMKTYSSQDRIQRFVATHGIRFHFNPPAAPHQGGLWESAIKSAKHHLLRVMGTNILTLPEFTTLITRIEAMLNSRPLTPLSSDPSDVTALTPGHFLTGDTLISLTEPDLTSTSQNRLKHWQLLQKLHQHIWQRWSKEYLHTLQQRSKWIHKGKNLKIGDLVLVNTSSSPLNWPLARIVSLHPGTDGVVRVVTIKTSSGTFIRPAIKVFPLPMMESS